MSENKAPAATSNQEAKGQEAPVLIRLRGIELQPDGHGALANGNVRVGLDGRVGQLKYGRLEMTTAPRFGTGMHDGWVLDLHSGFVVAWRGVSKLTVSTGHITNVMALDDYKVIFWRDQSRVHGSKFDYDLRQAIPHGPNDWLASMGPLLSGEVMLDARRPKSLVRRVRRARQAGAREIPGTGLLLFEHNEPAEWPPPVRERAPRARAGEGKNHPNNKRW